MTNPDCISKYLPMAILGAIAGFIASQAQGGTNLSLRAGFSSVSGSAHSGFESSAFVGGLELTESVSGMFEPGVFVDVNTLSTTQGRFGGMIHYGMVMRFNFPSMMGFFFDGKLGATHGTIAADSEMALGYGFGAGFKFDVGGGLKIAPHVGMRMLTSETGVDPAPSRNMLDFSLMFTYPLGGSSFGGGGGGLDF